MDNETIIRLVNAGYSKEEIETMEKGTKEDGAGNEGGETLSKGDEVAGKEPSNAGAENAGEIAPDVLETIKALTDTVAGLSETVKAMQDKNAAGAKTSKPSKGDAIKAAMDSFIETL